MFRNLKSPLNALLIHIHCKQPPCFINENIKNQNRSHVISTRIKVTHFSMRFLVRKIWFDSAIKIHANNIFSLPLFFLGLITTCRTDEGVAIADTFHFPFLVCYWFWFRMNSSCEMCCYFVSSLSKYNNTIFETWMINGKST